MHPQKVFTICGMDYTVIEKISSGGQGALYRAQNTSGCKQFAIKMYKVPSDPVQRNAQREYLKKSFQHNRKIAEASFQSAFVPEEQVLDEENGIYLELMKYSTDDCKTADEQIREWDANSDSGLPRLVKSVGIVKSLLNWLESYHETGLVHRDIKPGNLFTVLKTGNGPVVFPIDFGSSCRINEPHPIRSFSEGYSHPELPADSSSIQRDLYSTVAVFIHLIMGKRAINEYTLQLLDLYDIATGFEQMKLEVPYGVEWKIRKIVKKTVEFGYNSAENLRKDFEILLQIIAQRGIHEEVLVDLTAQELKLVKTRIYGASFDCDLLPELGESISGNTLILAPGGSGKTSTLINLWQEELARVNANGAIPVYVPLAGFEIENRPNWNTYIRDHILSQYFQVGRTEENRAELARLFKNGKKRIRLLLDGVNESLNSDRLGSEVSKLLQYPKVEVILASRHSNIHWGCIKEFKTVKILPLSETLVNRKLENAGFQKAAGRLLDTLTRPFFLCRYLEIGKPKKYEDSPKTPGEILFKYHQYLIDAFAAAEHESTRLLLWECCLYQFLPGASFRIGSMTFDSGEFAAICQDMGVAEAEAYISILEDCGLVYQTGKNRFKRITYYQFAHQHYLHFYQSLHAAGQIFGLETGSPEMLKGVIPEEVLLFLAEIWNVYQAEDGHSGAPVSIEDWLQTHVAEKPETKMIVRNLLEVLKYQKQNQLQGICFDNLDFTESNFFHSNLESATFDGSILPGRAFIHEHHRNPLEKVLVASRNLIVTTAANETKIIAWSMADGNHRFTMDTGEVVLQYAISSDEKLLAAACSSVGENSCRIYVFSLEDGHLCKSFSCSSFPIRLFSFLPGNEAILLDHYGREIKKLDIVTNRESVIGGSNLGSLNNAAASLDGSIFLRSFDCHQHPVSVLLSLQPFEVHTVDTEGRISSRNFSYRTKGAPIGKWVFSSDHRRIIGETLYGNSCNLVIFSIDESDPPQKATVPGILQCASSRYVFTSKKVWDYDANLDVSGTFGYESGTECHASLSMDGKLVAITKGQSTVTVFNTETLQCVLRFQPTVVSADSSLGDDRQIHVAGRTVLRRLPSGYVDCLDLETKAVKRIFKQIDGSCLVFCQDSRYTLQEHRDRAGFTLWNIAEKKQIATFYGSLSNVQRAQYLPEEKALVLIKEKQHNMKNSWLPVDIFLYNVQAPRESNYLNVLMSAEISSCAVIAGSIILGTADGELQVRNCTGTLRSKGQAHKSAIQKILPVVGSNRVVSRDIDGRILLWNLETMGTWEVNEHDPGSTDFDLSIDVVVDASAASDLWPANSKLIRRRLTYAEGALFWIDAKDFAFNSRIRGDGKIFLMGNMFLQMVSSTTDGNTLFELSSMAGNEIVFSASVSDDGELMAVIASNGKTEIYTQGDPTPLVWDVLDVDSVVNADLGGAKLFCSDYIREQLRLNGAILPEEA